MLLSATAGRRAGFRDWRRGRPFWAGVWTLLAGVEILSIPLAPLALMIHEGVAGVSGMLMGVFLVVLALTLWLAPHHRVFAGIATLVFAVASLVLSNFGGFLIGFLLGALGGAMAVSWTPDAPQQRPRPVRQPGLNWPHDGDDGDDANGGGPGPGPNPGPGSGGSGPASGPTSGPGYGHGSTGKLLRAIGVLPAGGALLAGGVHPLHPAQHAATPAAPPDGGGSHDTGGGLTVCSLLDALLAAAGPTVHIAGDGGPVTSVTHAGAPSGSHDSHGIHLGVDGPLGLHASVHATLPGLRTPGPPAPDPPRTGGLLGAVTGLLGLNPPEHEGGSASRPAPGGPGPAPGRPDSAAPESKSRSSSGTSTSASAPLPVTSGKPGVGTGDSVSPSLLRLVLPRLPADHGMDGVLSGLPLQLRLGEADPHSPWCLDSVSLALSLGAARYDDVHAAAQPFRVRTPLLALTGLTYHGITDVPTASGPQRVLAFTAYRVDIASLRQTAALLAPGCGPGPGGFPYFHGLPGLRLPLLDMGIPGIGLTDPDAPPPWAACQGESETDGDPDGTTTATGEPVVLLTRVLSGDLLGLLPVTFTPDMPPPLPPGLTVPIPLFFTDVTTYDQYLSADDLTVPGLHQTATG
ncbi:DUF6114 domain-containing protein [Streptantibioticus parmotrematis]|uniref:DUF6114 domain-containing protein n=1 Tax=Streptantibioticus parmotrematis TaxID=2873249 RepID=UPI0033FA131C